MTYCLDEFCEYLALNLLCHCKIPVHIVKEATTENKSETLSHIWPLPGKNKEVKMLNVL